MALTYVLGASVSAALVLFCPIASAQEAIIQPSFGLKWGESVADVEARYEVVDRNTSIPGIVGLTLVGGELPSNTKTITALFTDDYGLVKFVWESSDFTDDLYGSQGKREFEKLHSAISKRLGGGEKMTIVGEKIFDEGDEFYQCLIYSGCGMWVAVWTGYENDNSIAILQLNGIARGVGYLDYGVESPNFSKWKQKQANDDIEKF